MLVEQDRILIRAGGGFLGVEEFLDLYAAAEIDFFSGRKKSCV